MTHFDSHANRRMNRRTNRRRSSAAALAITLLMSGCASLLAPPVNPGDTESDVLSRLGSPRHRYEDGTTHVLEYSTGPFGQRTWMARIGADGRLESYRQVLITAVFATIIVGKSTKEDVLHTIGAPGETQYFSRIQQEVWSYAYKENNAWDSLMHVYFDSHGIVRQMMNGPDLRFDPDSRFPLRR